MDSLLGVVTLVALAVTLVMAGVTWRILQEERARSAARVAALDAELARAGGVADPLGEGAQSSDRSARRVEASLDTAPPAKPAWNERPGTGEGRVLLPSASFPERDRAVASPATLFVTIPRPSSTRGLVVALLGVALLGSVLVLAMVWGSASSAAGRPARRVVEPLALVSLGHERSGAALTITGRVRASRAGPPLQGVTAVARLVDRDGVSVATLKAPLSVVTLGPGGDATFVLQTPEARRVSRYRLAFRLPDGTVLPHVDRRDSAGAAPPARPVEEKQP